MNASIRTRAISFGMDFVNPSTRWADIVAGPPAAASLAHGRKILGFAEARRAAAQAASAESAEAAPLVRAA